MAQWLREWKEDKKSHEKIYADMYRSFPPVCWACGSRRKPSWYHLPFSIERAHIVNKPRLKDRRCVVFLCSVCHRVQEGERFSVDDRVRVTLANMLWLKQKHDPEFYDLEFMQHCSVSILPLPEKYER
tara:strand:- start:1040 stop:1423 length:384 start_codon:yes stop_codon:yes gene_type:complete